MTTPVTPRPAPLWRKLAALVYDSLLLAALSMAYGATVLIIKINLTGLTLAEGEKANLGPLGFIGWLLVLISFYSFFWRRAGQTLGMRAWRLQLTYDHGASVPWAACIVRALTAVVSLTSLGLGYLWQLIDPEQLTWHDRASHTRVILLPKSE